MPDNIANFSLPGLLEITRPRLDRQRSKLRMPTKRIGDTLWQGIASVGPVRPGGVQPAYALASVKVIFAFGSPAVDAPLFVCSSAPLPGEGTVSITNATTWLFSVPVQPLPLGLGNYTWEIHTTDTAGNTTVYYVGTQLVAP